MVTQGIEGKGISAIWQDELEIRKEGEMQAEEGVVGWGQKHRCVRMERERQTNRQVKSLSRHTVVSGLRVRVKMERRETCAGSLEMISSLMHRNSLNDSTSMHENIIISCWLMHKCYFMHYINVSSIKNTLSISCEKSLKTAIQYIWIFILWIYTATVITQSYFYHKHVSDKCLPTMSSCHLISLYFMFLSGHSETKS